MNDSRRTVLKSILPKMEELSGIAAEILKELQYVLDEEQEAYDNLTEGLQSTANGQYMEECINTLTDVIDVFEQLDADNLCGMISEIANG